MVEAIQKVVPNWPPLLSEETIEGQVVGNPETSKTEANNAAADMPENENVVAVDFEDENGKDGDNALEYTRTSKSFVKTLWF